MNMIPNLQIKNANHREGVWKLLRYGFKEDNSKWNIIKPEKDEKMLLVLQHMSLKILKGGSLVAESFSFLMHDIKRIVHDKDSMALVTKQQNIKRRFLRFQFAGGMVNSAEDHCNQCVQILSHYVIPDNVNKDDQTEKPNDISLMQFVSEFVKNTKELSSERIKQLESLYPLEDIVDECLLDVDFPDIVVKVHEILEANRNPKLKQSSS